jgi:8-oxo-dGTP pyrophosphatase MutT (NUDIX family)
MAESANVPFCDGVAAASVGGIVSSMRLSRRQVFRTRLHLFAVGVRKRLTVGVRAVLFDGDRILLIRHTYTPGWQFPGGGVEPFETAEQAAARETLEETGYAVNGRPQLHGFMLNRIAGGGRDHVAVYVWRESSQVRPFAPNMEIAECAWFDATDLPEGTEAGTARRVAEILAGGVPPSEW